jgi:geranylgeranyl reductase
MESFEVVIVGAGPAGLACAEHLGFAGVKTLIIDPKEVIGDKPCGGLISDSTLKSIGSDIGAEVFRRVIIHTPMRKKVIRFRHKPFYTVSRKNLGRSQLHRATKLNSVEFLKSSVSNISGNHVFLQDGRKIAYRYLVGADGSSSIVRRYLGKRSKIVGIGIQYIIPRGDFQDLELFFYPKLFGPWYAWILPHGDYAAVGAGSYPAIIPAKKLNENLLQWLETRGIDVKGGSYEFYPLNSDYQGMCFGNIFLVGDAAGLVTNFTGEGIYPAVLSGREVAKKIINQDYLPDVRSLLTKHRFQRRVVNMLIRTGKYRFLLHELIIEILNFRPLRKFSRKTFA